MIKDALTIETALEASNEFIKTIEEYPGGCSGRGIIICAGKWKYFTPAWVCIKMLRRWGCSLPIQVWHLGAEEIDERMRSATTGLGVEFVDAYEVRKTHPARILRGWEVKPYAILHSKFEEVILLDADNVPLIDPESLFSLPQYKTCGAVFWPDRGRTKASNPIWRVCGIDYVDAPEFESGQIVVDKAKVWKELKLTMWYNEHSDLFYRLVHGDKETFQLAWRKLGTQFAMPPHPVKNLPGTMCQHDFVGNRILQHRGRPKWSITEHNPRIDGFMFEDECLFHIGALKAFLEGRIEVSDLHRPPEVHRIAVELCSRIHVYQRIGHDSRNMSFSDDGRIQLGSGGMEQYWNIRAFDDQYILEIYSKDKLTAELTLSEDGIWRGRWEHFERMRVELHPLKAERVLLDGSQREVFLRCPVNGHTGYGIHASQMASHLEEFGVCVHILPTTVESRFVSVPESLTRKILLKPPYPRRELILHPPHVRGSIPPGSVFFTMWETDLLPGSAVERLNLADHVIVPCEWNYDGFRNSGVKRPIHIIPLGYQSEVFNFCPMPEDNLCIFGTGGRMKHGGTRKGFDEVIEAFLKAFPSEQDVRLEIKAFPDCEIKTVNDHRIKIIRSFMTHHQLAGWYRNLSCFVSGSHAEGWGLMQLEAMATGRPVITVRYGGVAEFFDSDSGYSVPYTEVSSTGLYQGVGKWAEPDEEYMIESLRDVYHDRRRAAFKGEHGAQRAALYTWRASHFKLLKLLQRIGHFA